MVLEYMDVESGGSYGDGRQTSPRNTLLAKLRAWSKIRFNLSLKKSSYFKNDVVYKVPLMLFFFRAGSKEAKELALETMRSLEYWNKESSSYIDMLVLGWRKRGKGYSFDLNDFLKYKNYIQEQSNWRYSGGSDILVLNYSFDGKNVKLLFNETITLKIEEMLKNSSITSMSSLVQDILSASKSVKNTNAPVWEISDKLGMQNGGKVIWNFIATTFLKDISKIYEKLKPFAVCDLSKN